MADRTTIHIHVPARFAYQVREILEDEFDYEIEPPTDKDGTIIRNVHTFECHEVAWGCLDDQEAEIHELGIPFDVIVQSDVGIDPCTRYYRPGKPVIETFDDEPNVTLADLQALVDEPTGCGLDRTDAEIGHALKLLVHKRTIELPEPLENFL